MTDYNIYSLKIDNDFMTLIPPLKPEERRQLEENIVADGCREPLCVWNKTILDGHNRYEICTRLKIPFQISYIFLRNKEEAFAWICANQLGRRNISEEARRYLIGKRYMMEKLIGAHNAAGTNQYTRKEVRSKIYTKPRFDDTAIRTRERLGNEYRMSPATIAKYGDYSHAIDTISKIEPKLLPRILSGQIKVSQANILILSKLSTSDIQRLSADLLENDIAYMDSRSIVSKKPTANHTGSLLPQSGSVKDMPAYDPDAEIRSLVLTIPSWVRSIDRARSVANLKEATSNACQQLQDILGVLSLSVDNMLRAIKEEHNERI